MKTMVILLLGLCSLSCASAAAPSAEQLLAQAKTKASAEQKAVFVHFGASWCGWCKRLDALLERPDFKAPFEKYFVPVKLVVQENAKNKGLENAGAEALLKQWGGPDGLPFSAFLGAKGTLIVNSQRPSGNGGKAENIGYPGQAPEADWFVQMIRKAAPRISEADVKAITAALNTPSKS